MGEVNEGLKRVPMRVWVAAFVVSPQSPSAS
jgi:hypothetical protein